MKRMNGGAEEAAVQPRLRLKREHALQSVLSVGLAAWTTLSTTKERLRTRLAACRGRHAALAQLALNPLSSRLALTASTLRNAFALTRHHALVGCTCCCFS